MRTFALAILLPLLAAAGLTLGGCDVGPTERYVLEAVPPGADDLTDSRVPVATLVDQSIPVLTRRLNDVAISVESATREGDDRLVLDVAGVQSRRAIEALIGNNVEVDLKPVDINVDPVGLMQGIIPPGSVLLPRADSDMPIAVRKFGGLRRLEIVEARVGFNPQTNQRVVIMQLSEAGTKKLASLSQANVGKPLAFVINGEVMSAPIIAEPIVGGSFSVPGNFTEEQASILAAMLTSGALPTFFRIVVEGTVK